MDFKTDCEMSNQISKYSKLVYYCYHKLPQNIITTMYYDDIIQEGFVGLWQAMQYYDVNRHNVKFSTYACSCIEHRLRDAIRKYGNSYDRNGELTALDNEECIQFQKALSEYNRFDSVETNGAKDLVSEIKRISSPRWVKLMSEYMSGYNQTDLAEKYGLTRQALKSILYKIKGRAIRKIGEDKINSYLQEN